MEDMTFRDTNGLASRLGVSNIRPGRIIEVESTPNDVLDALVKHNFVIRPYDSEKGPMADVYYFRANKLILGAVPEAEGVPTQVRVEKGTGTPSRKPASYKDGGAWFAELYPAH